MLRTLILTPLPVEFRAVAPYLTDRKAPEYEGSAAYEIGYFQGQHHQFEVIVCEPGMRNLEMALAAERAINRYAPQLVLLVGIAGGVKDVEIGDVVVANRAYGYESGKETQEGFLSRPMVEGFSGNLLARARTMTHREDWKKRASENAKDSKAIIGAIAAGDKVITTKDSEVFKRLVNNYNDTKALEMEAIGFAMAVKEYRELHGLAIRGISDLLDHKTDDAQPLAAANAAAFAFELLYQLDASDFLKPQQQPQKNPPPTNVQVSNSENVIIGGQFNTTGNIHIGNNINMQGDPGSKPELIQLAQQVQKMIAKGGTEDALSYLQQHSRFLNPTQNLELVSLSERMRSLVKKKRMGILSNRESTLEQNQIVLNLLEFVKTLNL